MAAEEVQQLAAQRVRINSVVTAPVGPSQILVYNEGYRHLQLAEQLTRATLNRVPVHGPVALFFCEDLTEPKLELVDLHAGNVQCRCGAVSNLG